MFQVGRYDPKQQRKQVSGQEPRKSKNEAKKKRKRKQEDGPQQPQQANHPPRALDVIAPDETDANAKKGLLSELHQKKPTLSAQEAFDDLDLLLLEPQDEGDTVGDDSAQVEDVGEAGRTEIKMALAMAEKSIDQAANLLKLAPFLVEKLEKEGFKNFFPIQALAIADVLLSDGQYQQQDICITAATGSGKTLAYALPIVHALARRPRGCRRELRALVVLPSRDLATQVYQVFQSYVDDPACDLKVGLAIGQTNFTAEQMALTIDKDSEDPENLRRWLSFDPGNLELALQFLRRSRGHHAAATRLSSTSSSAVDILVCTPGRLVDHLDSTPGFSLEHLQFLVVDEADRLLNQRYHNWMDRVLESRKLEESNHSRVVSVPRQQLRKFLVSATLTRDPQKLASLRLNNPKHFNTHQLKAGSSRSTSQKMYGMPESLKEFTLECTAEQKPLVLLALLLELVAKPAHDDATKRNLVVVFTSSLDATHRLSRLLQLLWPFVGNSQESPVGLVAEFSSAMNQKERSSLVRQCNQPSSPISVVVCSDGMSRGMDLNNVGAVIHYDVPSAAKTYVHRSGRTARAGASGTTITLLKGAGQAGQFGKMRRLIQAPERVVSGYNLQKSLVRGIPYRECVTALREVLEAEDCGELRKSELLPQDYIPSLGQGEEEEDDDEAMRGQEAHGDQED